MTSEETPSFSQLIRVNRLMVSSDEEENQILYSKVKNGNIKGKTSFKRKHGDCLFDRSVTAEAAPNVTR